MVSAYQKSLAEFAARRRQRNKIIFSRDMCVRENTARAASVEFVRHRRANYARSRPQAFCRKNPEGFSTVSDRPRRRSLLREFPHQLPSNEHPIPRKYPPPFRQGRVWEVRTAGRCGERTERCQWQRKRGERVAAVKISSVRRKAAQKFWAPQQDHRPLRNSIENPCVGADAYIGPVAPIFKSYVGRRALTPPRWRSGYRTAGWGQPALQCLAPLPKGGLGGRIATASVRTDLAMTGFPWSVVHGRRATARVAPTEGYKECLAGGRTGASAPTDMWKRLRRAGLQEVRQNGPSGTPAPTDSLVAGEVGDPRGRPYPPSFRFTLFSLPAF